MISETEREKYQRYLCSREWSEKRELVRQRSGGKCERCKRNPMDACHHLTYIRKYNEDLEDLQAICNACHEFTHGKTDFDPALNDWNLEHIWNSGNTYREYIYLAGKVGGPKHSLAKNAKSLSFAKAEFMCTDGNDHSEHLLGFGYDLESWLGIDYYSPLNDIEGPEKCFGLIAFIDCRTAFGTIAEIGFFSGQGKPVYVICDPSKRPDDYSLCCNGKDNNGDASWFDTYWFTFAMPGVTGEIVYGEANWQPAFDRGVTKLLHFQKSLYRHLHR